ncbi:MAG: transglycosylase domain-containing protein [Pseudomonadota bacterium]|nr:transglycosylase domain-containing protein [Pseudomonadota bacterium]
MILAALYTVWNVLRGLLLSVLWIGLAFACGLAVHELISSEWQAHYLAKRVKQYTFRLEPGPSDRIRFPTAGPFDERFGYAGLAGLSKKLVAREFDVAEQVRMSPQLIGFMEKGLSPPYREKTQAGLRIYDCSNTPMFSARYPERIYPNFEAIPRLLVDTLLFIENRELLDPSHPKRNPAVEWDRFGKALLDQFISIMFPEHDTQGGSTLATQIEKYRHSPDGRTNSGKEKLRQMASASLRAYLDGEDTTSARQRIVMDYLNTVPLAAQLGYGEVNGVGDGLWAWYGRDFAEVNLLLQRPVGQADIGKQAEAYKQALSLMIAERRPSDLLNSKASVLNELANSHLRMLAEAGVIMPTFRDAAIEVELALSTAKVTLPPSSFATRKVATTVRTHLSGVANTSRLYDLDRLDLAVTSTLNSKLQKSITDLLYQIKDRAVTAEAGLNQKQLLENSDPAKVIYSFTLFERTERGNLLRVQTDNYEQPFDINQGTKLDLGSTAKFRTLVTYLEIIASLHTRYAKRPKEELAKIEIDPRDVLTRWAIDYLKTNGPGDLPTMLESAMDRDYSASPAEQFFTGGGAHRFDNFSADDDSRVMPLREGFRNSVNLVFVRMMRDVVRHYMFQTPGSSARLLTDAKDPRRKDYLARFADREGRIFVRRFLQKYRDKSAAEAEALLIQGIRATAPKLAAIFRIIDPEAGVGSFTSFLDKYLEQDQPKAAEIQFLYDKYAPAKFTFADRGYTAGVHPLELWVVSFLRAHPGATAAQVQEGSSDERQAVYRWLFNTRRKNAQDRRILSLLEVEGFLEVHRAWKRLGYPFDSLVPSYASALGSSADRPAALAELMGIIVNEGIRRPAVRLQSLHFASATPYETRFEPRPQAGERVLPKEVTDVARRALIDVVESGTARRLRGALVDAQGNAIDIGGKTGTGDHRFDTYGKSGQLISSRVVNRSATFMFLLSDRFFGTLVAYVPGEEAAKYHFTSALATQILKNLMPTLAGLFDANANANACL